jgi:hypothetical protein
MGNFGYIGAAPTQSAGANKGILSNADIIDLKNKTPEQISGDFINLDFFACAGGGGGGGGSYQHGYGATYAGGGGGGEALLSENNKTYFKLGTTYAITIGAGGTKGDGTSSAGGNGEQGGAGGNTTIATEAGTLTMLGGGGGGRTTWPTAQAGSAGGSGGGGGAGYSGSVASGGASTASDGVGNAGGAGLIGTNVRGGAGGGATAAGENMNATNNLPYGYFSLEYLRGAGNPPARNGYYVDWIKAESVGRGSTLARGGGNSSTVNDAIANTGHGGMGKYEKNTGMHGGSGIVAFRYPSSLTITASSATVTTATVGDKKITEVTASSGGTVRWD